MRRTPQSRASEGPVSPSELHRRAPAAATGPARDPALGLSLLPRRLLRPSYCSRTPRWSRGPPPPPGFTSSQEPSSHRRLRHRPRAAGRLRSQARTARRSQRGYQWFRVLGRYAAGQRLYSDSRVQRYPLWPWRGPPSRGRQSVVGGKAPAGGDHGGGLCRTAHRIHRLSHAQGDRGPVTAQLRPADARRLVEAVKLPSPEPDFLCFEDVLLYSISLHPPGHASPGYVLRAYSCGYDLFVSVDGVPIPPLWSGGCRLPSDCSLPSCRNEQWGPGPGLPVALSGADDCRDQPVVRNGRRQRL